MKNRIKVFQESADQVEVSVNHWIIERENSDHHFEIVNITTSGTRTTHGSPVCIVTIHYLTD